MVREVGVHRTKDRVALEFLAELPGESRRLQRRQAVFLDEREVCSLLSKSNSMSSSIGDILNLNVGVAFLWWGGFLAVYVQRWPHCGVQGGGSYLLLGGIFLLSLQPALQCGDEIVDGNVLLLLLLLLL